MYRTMWGLMGVAAGLYVASFESDQMLGIPGIHFFFLGIGIGIFGSVAVLVMALGGCHHDA